MSAKGSDSSEGTKRRAGERAAAEVEDGAIVGLGTGSTAAFAIRAVGRAIEAGERSNVRGIPTSAQARTLAIEAGIPLTTLEEVDGVDLAIDGADQVVDGDLLKGGGAAHAREKVVDAAADRFLVVADASKVAETIDQPIPVEVLPVALRPVSDRIREMGGEPTLRTAQRKDGPVVTDNGNIVLDCAFGDVDDPPSLAAMLSSVPGVVEHGLFLGLADAVYVGTGDGVDVRRY